MDSPQQRRESPSILPYQHLLTMDSQAVAVSETMEYSLVHDSTTSTLLIVCTDRIAALEQILSSTLTPLTTFSGQSLLSTTYKMPLSSSLDCPIFAAPYVTSVTGTGLVHTSPAHGIEDWMAWRSYQSSLHPNEPLADTICAVDGAGKFSNVLESMVEKDVAAVLVGTEVLSNGTETVIQLLRERGSLLKEVEYRHKFPYDWRTKKPVIFRSVSFLSLSLSSLKLR